MLPAKKYKDILNNTSSRQKLLKHTAIKKKQKKDTQINILTKNLCLILKFGFLNGWPYSKEFWLTPRKELDSSDKWQYYNKKYQKDLNLSFESLLRNFIKLWKEKKIDLFSNNFIWIVAEMRGYLHLDNCPNHYCNILSVLQLLINTGNSQRISNSSDDLMLCLYCCRFPSDWG